MTKNTSSENEEIIQEFIENQKNMEKFIKEELESIRNPIREKFCNVGFIR